MDKNTAKRPVSKPSNARRHDASSYRSATYAGGRAPSKGGAYAGQSYGGRGKPADSYFDDTEDDDINLGGSYKRRSAPPQSAKTAKRPKSRYAALFAIVILAGAVICVSAFALMINSLTKGAATPTPEPTDRVNAFPVIENRKEVRQVCLIKGVDLDTRTLTLYYIDGGNMFYMTATNATDMKDSYGKSLVFGEYKLGDVVDVMYYEGETQLVSIKQNAQAQLFSNQDGIIVDAANNKITRLNTPYIYGQELVCLYKGEEFDVSKVSTVDKVTMRVYRNIAVYVEVLAGHGAVNVTYNEYIRDGSLEIDPAGVYTKLNDSMDYNLPEGSYRVVVKGSNIENFIRDINVKGGETITVNLEDVQFKRGFLYFSSNVSLKDIYLTVNGTQVDPQGSLALPYGAYEIKATSMGYEPFEKIFEFDKPDYTFPITMTPLPTPTPRPEKADTVKLTINTYVNSVAMSGAEVYVDGMYVGQTPITFDIELGSRSLLIKKEGFFDTEISPFIVTDEYPILEKGFNLQEIGTALP